MTSQYVGIGNVATNPLTWLHVKGNHQGVVTITQEDNSFTDDTYSLYIDNALQTANKDNSGAFAIDVEAGRAFTVTGNGKIGINKTRPTSFLDVAGTGAFTGQVTAPTFLGDLNGTINTLTTAVTQSANNNSTKVATTAYADAAASAVPIGDYLPLAGGTLTGALTGTSATFAGIITANSSSSGDYVRMYGSSGTGKWDIYGNGANLRISDNESAGILAVDTGATFGGNVQAPSILANGFAEIRSDTASLYFENSANNNYYRLKRDASNNFKIDYYNGSTTSDRLTIDSSGNVGIGVTPNASYSKLQVKAPASSYGFDLIGRDAGSNSESQITFWNAAQTTVQSAIYNVGQSLHLYVAGNDRLVIDSSGNSTFAGDVNIGNGVTAEKRLVIDCSNPVFALKETDQSANSRVWGMQSIASKLYFRAFNDAFTAATDVMVLDRSGNVGIGTDSPSAYTYGSNLVIKNTGYVGITIQSNTTGASVIQFADGDSGAAQYRGGIDYYHSGNANANTMGFRANGGERMRILSDGNIFMDSPKGSGENLNLVISDTTTGYAAGTGGSILFQGIFNSSNNLGGAAAIQASKTNSTDGDYSYNLDFYTRKFGSAIERRMVIDSSGNAMIGGTSTFNGVTGETGFEIYGDTAQLLINNPTYNWFTIYSASDANIYNVFGSSGDYLIGTGNKDTSSWSEKIRVRSGGNVHIGTGAGTLLSGGKLVSSFDGATNNGILVENKATGTASQNMIVFTRNAAEVGSIASTNTTTTYVTSSSDKRLKKNINVWQENVLDKFKDIKPKQFHFNNQNNSEEKTKGYIAQNEVHKFPEAYPLKYHEESKEDRHQFNPSGMTVYLMKAIQELTAKVEMLEKNCNCK